MWTTLALVADLSMPTYPALARDTIPDALHDPSDVGTLARAPLTEDALRKTAKLLGSRLATPLGAPSMTTGAEPLRTLANPGATGVGPLATRMDPYATQTPSPRTPGLFEGNAPQLIEYSDAYLTRLKIHRWASFLTLPLFASEYVVGQRLQNGHGPSGRTRRNGDRTIDGPFTGRAHRNMAIVSMATSVAGYAIMLPPFRRE